MKKRITLKHIAAHFNISIAAVSKALNNSHDISASTRAKVQLYAKEHNYKPNINAINLKKRQKSTKTIGIIIPNILNLFFAKVFSGIEQIANDKGYNLTICISNDSHQKEVDAAEMLMNSEVDGIIVSLAQETQMKNSYQHFNNVITQGISLVMFDRVTDQIECDKVTVDDFQAGYNATNFFIKSNHKHIAILSKISDTSVGKLRLEGYQKALESANIPIDPNLILKLKKNEELEPLLKITLGSRKVDGLLCLEESAAIEALEILKKQGVKIPQEISIIGFTNGELPRHVSPTLTTVSQHGIFVGKTTMKYLHEQINCKTQGLEHAPRIKVIKTNIIERDSTLNN